MAILKFTLAITLTLCMTLSAMAASAVGEIEYWKGEVEIIRGQVHLAVESSHSVFEGDRIVTGQSARVRIRFIDDSIMQMGENAESRIGNYGISDDGVFDGLLELLQGRARFIISKLKEAKARYQVQMRTVLIGVRGTDILAQIGGADHIALLEGRIELSDTAGGTMFLNPDRYVEVSKRLPNYALGIPEIWLDNFIRDVGSSSDDMRRGKRTSDDDSLPHDTIREKSSRSLGSPSVVPR